ncbi:dihydropyrimidinase [Clostridium sp. MCC353]|uniref:dihydropyrimidinase n=1 Tax=Clostridium sp. MCC353 TaxID=2592646 RepID=UPI001C0123F3|nr:dihydropyrimidinase [Clostridium sp. MCC353]MBT9776487.1 dihydropyrimidinase [Clostridium sp. MCC353]
MKRLLKGGTVVMETYHEKLDVLMDDESGTICRVAEGIVPEEGTEVVDVTGKLLFPGFIDAHTHFDLEVSGTVTADDFETGTKAAIAGGTTMIIDFATQNKGETLHEALANWHKKADGKSSCDYGFHMAISDWNEEISRELEELVNGGITSFKVYMTYDNMVLDDKEIYQVLKRLKEVGGITGVHCENSGLIKALIEEQKAKGNLIPSAHPKTRPDLVEAEAVSRLLKIADLAKAPVIVVHLSSGAGYQEVKYARERGQEVYLETCPQYLLMDDSYYDRPDFEGAKYVCSPPLRKTTDQTRLWNALRKNNIQTVSTDHCSFTMKQKEAGIDDFTKIPNGMPGVESRPVLFYTYGVLEKDLTLEQMCRMLSANPAKLYGVYPEKGCIKEGSHADIVVWDPDAVWVMTKENQHANTDYCPFEGTEVKGIAGQVYLRGELAAENGVICKEHKGTYVKRRKYIQF